MKVCVQGLWHLGSVTAACLASVGHEVVELDSDIINIKNLNQGKAPIFESGLDSLIQKGIDKGRLSFTTNVEDSFLDTEILFAYDTPVYDHDKADTGFVLDQLETTLPALDANRHLQSKLENSEVKNITVGAPG